jgi:RNA polymerase primary sigma factor
MDLQGNRETLLENQLVGLNNVDDLDDDIDDDDLVENSDDFVDELDDDQISSDDLDDDIDDDDDV